MTGASRVTWVTAPSRCRGGEGDADARVRRGGCRTDGAGLRAGADQGRAAGDRPRAAHRRRRAVGHREPALHDVRQRAPDLLAAHDRVRRAPDGPRGGGVPPPQRGARLPGLLRRALRPAPALRAGHPGGLGPPARGRLGAGHRARRRAAHPRVRGPPGRLGHPAHAPAAAAARRVQRHRAALLAVPLAVGVHRSAGAGRGLRQLRRRHRRRRGAPRRERRPERAARLPLPAQVRRRPAHRHPRRPAAAAAGGQAARRRGADPRPRRPAQRLRPARPRLPALRVAPGRELAGAAPPRARRHHRAARHRRDRGPPGHLRRRRERGVRRAAAGHRLRARLPLPRPRRPGLASGGGRAAALPQRLPPRARRPLRDGDGRGHRAGLGGPAPAGAAGRALPGAPPGRHRRHRRPRPGPVRALDPARGRRLRLPAAGADGLLRRQADLSRRAVGAPRRAQLPELPELPELPAASARRAGERVRA